jgi:hypothetical protein
MVFNQVRTIFFVPTKLNKRRYIYIYIYIFSFFFLDPAKTEKLMIIFFAKRKKNPLRIHFTLKQTQPSMF